VGAGDKVIVEPVLLDFAVAKLSMWVRVLLRFDSTSCVTKGEDDGGSSRERLKVLASGEGATGLAPESTLGRWT